MPVVVASTELSDEEFLAAFTTCKLPLSSFRHGDHLRLGWLLLHRMPFDDALTLVRDGIRRYAAYHGLPGLFHETVTTAWLRLLATHHEISFGEFIHNNEDRLTSGLLHNFWSLELLRSDEARLYWVAPDRQALPNDY